jgi:hypothetical protein|tara:strand:+ start:821 stop:1087 length:267 start_codon:yes stop_codon:yes gene_type:complete
MAGKVGTAECHKCYKKFPKTKMSQEKVKGNKSGSSFSFGKRGLDSMRVHSGRQYYRKAWICNDCGGGGCLSFLIWLIFFGMIISIFGK